MFSILKIVLVAAMAPYASATTWAQFCDDTACSVNCGESVSVDNPGCLNESGRNSITFHDGNIQAVDLVFSPSPDCPCQNECVSDIVSCDAITCTGYNCYDLSGHAPAQSFRFVGRGGTGGSNCGPNNC